MLVVLAVIGLFGGVFSLFWLRTGHKSSAEARLAHHGTAASRDGTVVFQAGDIPRFPPHTRGEELTREQFVALTIDEHATKLARKALQESANGTTVSWLLRTEDIFDSNGTLHGHFTLPHEIREGRSTRGSAITVNCEFAGESRESLLKVRRGDWVVVRGTLSLDGREVAIKEARILDDSAPPQAERP